MILDIYKDAFEYSAQDWKTLLILGVICLFSVLLLPIFLITGYNYRVINNAVHGVINGRDPLPKFDEIVNMFVDGIKVAIVQIAYVIVPVIIFLFNIHVWCIICRRCCSCCIDDYRMLDYIGCWRIGMFNESNGIMSYGI